MTQRNLPTPNSFSGSYEAEDVNFLLKVTDIESTPTEEKERLIQTGARHYSEMLAAEQVPDPDYMRLYEDALRMNGQRMARDLVRLARSLATRRPEGEIVLVSLARAGTPIGVLLRRGLDALGRRVAHYSISIIRDRGIDTTALDYICSRHDPEALVFVDGWTGKGTIAQELVRAVGTYGLGRGVRIDPRVVVLADLAGAAALAATSDDYLIPSSILNAVVSGLVSRTVLSDRYCGPGDFHACRYYHEFTPFDVSRAFVETIASEMRPFIADPGLPSSAWDVGYRKGLQQTSLWFLHYIENAHGIRDHRRIKPGIGESTRALLRRLPERLLLQSADGPDVCHLHWLARRSAVPIDICPDLPYRATVLIRSLGEG